MASPAKAFIDPNASIIAANPLMNGVPCVASSKSFFFTTGNHIYGWPVQTEEIVPRFTIAATFAKLMNPAPCLSPKPNTKEGKNMTMNTFSSIYQERGASATRSTEGQLYPLGI